MKLRLILILILRDTLVFREYMDSTKELAKKNLYVETILGRKLHVTEINASNGLRRQAAERAAINAPLQGSAADIIKKAMIDVDEWIGEDNPNIKMIMQVHDELIFEVKKDFAEEALTRSNQPDGKSS
jgi:DNA polymerase-1